MRNSSITASIGALVAFSFFLLGVGVSRVGDRGKNSGGDELVHASPGAAPSAPARPPRTKRVVKAVPSAPASNRTHLILMRDQNKVLGWISGTRRFAGQHVEVRFGARTERVTVSRDNTFRWYYRVAKPIRVTFKVGFSLTRHLTVRPSARRKPSAFFVADRTVYRPGQKLHFVAFLRRLGPRGQFRPVRNTFVVVRLRSVKKKSVAARLKLISDQKGRLVGDYQFMEADPLDDYTLSIKGYKGDARIKLAEFRKSKVKLVVNGKVKQGSLRLRFSTIDFVGKPVPGARVQFEAQVVKRTVKRPVGLKVEKFVYAEGHKSPTELPAWHELPEVERLLIRAGEGQPVLSRAQDTVVAQFKGQLDLGGSAVGEHPIDLNEEWLRPGHMVRVKAVVVDQNGREQRAYHLLPLHPERPPVRLALDRRIYTPGEPIQLTIQGKKPPATSTLVVLRLSRLPHGQALGLGHRQLFSSSMIPIRNIRRPHRRRRGTWVPVQQARRIGHTLTTAKPIADKTTTLRINRPGAYKLVVISRFAGGQTVHNEVGCVIRGREASSPLAIQLDKTELAAGARLTGDVTSRYAGAKVLLTVYDGVGIRLWRTLQIDKGRSRIDLRLPRDLGYGAVVDVQYADRRGCLHVADEFFRVKQDHREIKITTEMESEVKPGKEVAIKVRVNRKEPVDLVVAVYDQSLLGIAPDRSIDIRDFYLADARARDRRARFVAERWIGHLTLHRLLRKTRRLLKAEKAVAKSDDGRMVQPIVRATGTFHLRGHQLAALLRLNGVNARWSGYAHHWGLQVTKAHRRLPLLDLLKRRRYGWQAAYQVYDGTLFLAARHPSQRQGGLWSQRWRGGMGHRARGDSHYSLSGNALHSISGQAFISHGPAAPAVALLQPEDSVGRHGVRTNFSDLAYWSAMARTDSTGVARVTFKVPDSLTNWRVVVTAISPEMHVGRHLTRFRTFKPVMVWPMLPRVFTQGDRIAIFARVHNRTDRPQQIRVGLKVKNGRVLTKPQAVVHVAPQSSRPVYWTYAPGSAGFTQILMTAQSPAGSDASLKRLPVIAASAKQRLTVSGFADGEALLRLPQKIDLATARLHITLVPSLAADLVDNLDYLVQYPYGCVEQTMSRFLPAIKVAQTLKRFRIRHPGLQARLPKVAAAGIKRLLELQRPDGGWGWHAQGQTHEMMTPYALYGLLQAERAGYEIGRENAIRRGLSRLRGFIQAMGPAQAADRIYAMYVYSHRRSMEGSWWKFIESQLEQSKLSDYALALALEMAVRNDRSDLAGRLARTLRRRAVRKDGQAHWRTANFSRWGNDRFEITAAALKALVAHDIRDPLIPGALAFFAATKRGNRWNSTKDTAMITFAIADYLAKQKRLERNRAIVFALNGGTPKRVTFTDGLTRKVTLPSSALHHGVNRIKFLRGSRTCLYRAVLRYSRTGRHIRPMNAGIAVDRRFFLLDQQGKRRQIKPGATIPWGSYVLSEVTATGSGTMRYLLLENPVPSGCEVLPAQDRRFSQNSTPYLLREDRTGKVAYHHETTPSRVVDRAVLHAEFAGDYVVAPAAVELMYQTRTHGHSGTFRFRVAPKSSPQGA